MWVRSGSEQNGGKDIYFMKEKYQIDTEADRTFLKELCSGLLKFGHRFPPPGD